MKKIILFTALLLSAFSFAQKTVYVFNWSSHNIDIGHFETEHKTTGYPHFVDNTNNFLISVPAGGDYTLSNPNNSYFPFYSPTSNPVITGWHRKTSPTASYSNLIPSANLNNVNAAPQILYEIKFQVGVNGNKGGAVLGKPENGYSWAYIDNRYLWYADVTTNEDHNIPTLDEKIFIIMDL